MIIDVNVSFGHWPFALHLPNQLDRLARLLAEAGIDQAHVSAAEAVLAPDPLAAAEPLLDQLAGHPTLQPALVLDPTLPTAQQDLAEALGRWPVRLLKLYPGFGGYAADDEPVAALIRSAGQSRVVSAVVLRVEDERALHRLMRPPTVDLQAIVHLAAEVAPLPLLVLNALRDEVVELLSSTDNLLADIAFVESGDSLPDLLQRVPAERIVFGSHAGLFYPQAAAAKLGSADIGQQQRAAIASGNIQAALAAVSGPQEP